MLLAESEPPASEERLRLYEIGAAAGQRAIEADFDTMVGEFWGFLETRSYMRARHGLALTLWDRGQHERAIEHYVGMLVLNPNDNQGIRYLLLAAYLEIGADAKARKLLKRYKNDGMADWSYGAALVAFREVGDAEVSRKALAKAIKANSRVVGYFTGKRKLPRSLPLYVSPGGDDEAIACCHLLKGAWSMTNGALEWLRSAASSS
jgi:tetratricopeptide (TPR) repeat protein